MQLVITRVVLCLVAFLVAGCSSAIPTVPSVSPTASSTARILATESPTSTATAVQPPLPVLTATPSLAVTISPVPAPTSAPPDDVQEALDQWLARGPDGRYPTNDAPQRWSFGGEFDLPLNIDYVENIDGQGSLQEFHGHLLASELIDGHLIVYLGFEDQGPSNGDINAVPPIYLGTNSRYFVPFDAGPLDSGPYWRVGTTSQADQPEYFPRPLQPLVSTADLITFLAPFDDHSVTSDVFSSPSATWMGVRISSEVLGEIRRQVGVVRDLATWSRLLADPTGVRHQLSDTPPPPDVAALIDHREVSGELALAPLPISVSWLVLK